MCADRAITILHLSDTQFGRNHRFGKLGLPPPDDAFDSLIYRLAEDLKLMRKKYRIRPDLMILTGDLAERGMPNEFEDVLHFIEEVAKLIDLKQDRIIMVPGNHDVNRLACEAYFLDCEIYRRDPERPYWKKWQHYDWLFKEFYGDGPTAIFSEAQPWTLFEIPDLKVVVAGLNSTMAESHKADDHYGWVGEGQLKWFAEKLKNYKARGWLRIGALHHNIRRGPVADDENLRDEFNLKKYLGNFLNLILHGHTHDGKIDWFKRDLPILSTGSAALAPDILPEETSNQYQIIQVYAKGFCRWARIYDHGGKRWVGDVRASKDGDEWKINEEVEFENVFALAPEEPDPLDADRKSQPQDDSDEGSNDRPNIIGRDVELDEICKQLRNYSCVYIYGPPGVGKTMLASEVARRLKKHFQGNIIRDFALKRKFDDVLNLIARFFSAEALYRLSPAEKLVEVKRLLRRRNPVLLYLDNVEAKGLVEQLEGLSGSCALLITSREISGYNWFKAKELEMLDRTLSIELFEQSYEQPLSDQDKLHVNEMCKILGDMPLAIHLCASRAKKSGFTISSLLSMDPLSVSKFRDRSVEAAIEFSYDLLENANKRFFAMLSLFEGRTFSIDVLGAMWAKNGAFDQLNQLVDLSLLEVAGEGRFVLHPLIHEYAVKRLKSCNEKTVFLDRLIAYYRIFAENNSKDFVKLGIERENILAAMEECDKKSDATNYCGFAKAMITQVPKPDSDGFDPNSDYYAYGYLPQRGFWDEVLHIVTRCLKLESDPIEKAKLKEHIGLIHYWNGDHEEATRFYKEAISVFREHKDHYGEAVILHRLGFVKSDEGFYRECEKLYRKSVAIAQNQHLDDKILATGIHLVGVILYHQCRYEESKENLEKALDMRMDRDSVAASVTKRRLAATYRRMGLLEDAEKKLLECLIVERKRGNERNIARCLRQLGMVNLASGSFDDASDNLKESWEIFQTIGNKKGIAGVLTNLGELNLMQGQIKKAEKQLHESLIMARELSSQYGIATNLQWIAEISYRRSEYRQAAEKALEALRHFESIEHVHVKEACVLLNRALLELNLEETCRLALPPYCDGECPSEIDKKYKKLDDEARILLAENKLHIDKHLQDLAHDKRRGISLIIRLSEETKRLLTRVSNRLQKVAPDHYYYAASDYHVTVMSLIVANEGFNRCDVPEETYKKGLSKVLSRQQPFRIRFRGIGATKDCIIAHGKFRDGTLDKIRKEIEEELTALRVEGQFEDRYPNISAHVTFVRFRSKNDLMKLVQEIDRLANCDLGVCPIEEIEFVTNDWYMSKDKVNPIDSFKLRKQDS